MKLDPTTFALVSTYSPDYITSGEFQGDDNDLAVVVSNACNKMADAGYADLAFKTFLDCTPRNCLPPIEFVSNIKVDYDERAAKHVNPDIVDFLVSGDIFGTTATTPGAVSWVVENSHPGIVNQEADEARMAAAAVVRAWMKGEIMLSRDGGKVRALPNNSLNRESALLSNSKAVTFLMLVLTRDIELDQGRVSPARHEAYKSLFSLMNGK